MKPKAVERCNFEILCFRTVIQSSTHEVEFYDEKYPGASRASSCMYFYFSKNYFNIFFNVSDEKKPTNE